MGITTARCAGLGAFYFPNKRRPGNLVENRKRPIRRWTIDSFAYCQNGQSHALMMHTVVTVRLLILFLAICATPVNCVTPIAVTFYDVRRPRRPIACRNVEKRPVARNAILRGGEIDIAPPLLGAPIKRPPHHPGAQCVVYVSLFSPIASLCYQLLLNDSPFGSICSFVFERFSVFLHWPYFDSLYGAAPMTPENRRLVNRYRNPRLRAATLGAPLLSRPVVRALPSLLRLGRERFGGLSTIHPVII